MSRSWQIKLNVDRIKASKRDAAARGLRKGAEHVLQVSRERVPIEEGTLERSGQASVDEQHLRAAVSYNTKYAVKQHEDMTLHHDAGREAKYLERPMASERDVVRRLIADEMREA